MCFLKCAVEGWQDREACLSISAIRRYKWILLVTYNSKKASAHTVTVFKAQYRYLASK